MYKIVAQVTKQKEGLLLEEVVITSNSSEEDTFPFGITLKSEEEIRAFVKSKPELIRYVQDLDSLIISFIRP